MTPAQRRAMFAKEKKIKKQELSILNDLDFMLKKGLDKEGKALQIKLIREMKEKVRS